METIEFLKKSIEGSLTPEEQEQYLISKKSLCAEELRDTVRFLQKHSTSKLNFAYAIDVCGTGGSGLNRINTSTISAFILAALNVKVAKHGNRAASGRFGSFDLLASLGIKFENPELMFKMENLCFLFAPAFHPVIRHFAEVRKKINKPTFFNLLGPLLNPANVKRQIIGTPFKDKMELIAETCRYLGCEHVFVVSGEDVLDEVTLTGKTYVVELNKGKIKKYTISPEDFGIKPCVFKEIEGNDQSFNTQIALDILKGKCKSRHMDLVLINTALTLKLAGKTNNLKNGYKMAKNAVLSGLAFRKFQQIKNLSNKSKFLQDLLLDKIKEVELKKQKLPLDKLKKDIRPNERDFISAIKKPKISLIAEIKRKSPLDNEIAKKSFSPAKIAKTYEKLGVAAISVLCAKKHFSGRVEHLIQAYKATKYTPLLCKNFIVDEYQIYEARKYGASAVLLIAAILNSEELTKFLKISHSLKMSCVCEIRTTDELIMVLNAGAQIIGINNRDLNTLKVDLSVTNKFAPLIPKDKIVISESGISSKKDIDLLPKNISAVLIGKALRKAKNLEEKIYELFPHLKPVKSLKKYVFNKSGHFGDFGGRYIPELLIPIMEDLEKAFYRSITDKKFISELDYLNKNYTGRPTPLYYCENLTKKLGGAKIYLKNEGLNHTGAHKINHCLGQALIAKKLGKTRIIAETGAGQHGLATATVAAKFGLKCRIYMGAKDYKRQKSNVFFMKRLGAEVIQVKTGGQILRDAINEALRDLISNPIDTHYLLGTVCGPHPYPVMNAFFQSIIGREVKKQILETEGKLPDYLVACIGGGSNAIGLFHEFLDNKEIEMIGVEAGGKGIIENDKKCEHAARFETGRPGVCEGFKSYFLQDKYGQIKETSSISAGLDYSGIGPQIAYLKEIGRIKTSYALDKEVLSAYEMLAKEEGIFAALESAHAVAEVIKLAPKLSKDKIIVFNCSGRGDKDLSIVHAVRRTRRSAKLNTGAINKLLRSNTTRRTQAL
ncbi:tryptophan synthase subunit beta [Candidatus Peregrinibacteria bacterium]|nr:tryptophan synthase subunit beta [Candidatus Peregrinibacteria bacterium]